MAKEYTISVSDKNDLILRAIAAKRGTTVEALVKDKLSFYLRQEIMDPEELLTDVQRQELRGQVESLKANFLSTALNLSAQQTL